MSLNVPVKSKQKLGKLLKSQRLKDKKSLRSLAADCEMSYATLNDIENGNGFPTEKVFMRLIENLNFSDSIKMYNTYAEIKETAPPDVIDFLSKSKSAIEVVRKIMEQEKGAT